MDNDNYSDDSQTLNPELWDCHYTLDGDFYN
jgi:hypothetical protein